MPPVENGQASPMTSQRWEAEHLARLERGSELPPIERTAAAPLLAPRYQLSLITSPRAIVDHPLRC